MSYIYSAKDRTPFTYLIGWSAKNIWYYGAKYSKGCRPSDLWTTYFTSSKNVHEFVKQFGAPDIINVRRVFNTISACRKWEAGVLLRINAATNDRFLNLSNGNGKFYNANKSCYTNGIIRLSLFTNDVRVLSGEFWHVGKGKKLPEWHIQKIKNANSGKYVSLETRKLLSKCSKGSVPVEDDFGNRTRMNLSDPRVISGEFKTISSKYITCTDQFGNVEFLCKTDPRLISGEFKNIRIDTIDVFDASGKLQFSSTTKFKDFCEEHQLPFSALSTSYRFNGQRIYQTKNTTSMFSGWFAIKRTLLKSTHQRYLK